jgi:hypothetical protein
VSVVCPAGHASLTTDYCDQCGAPIAATPAPPSSEAAAAAEAVEAVEAGEAGEVGEEVAEVDTSPAALQLPCPACGSPRSGDDRYCEECGHDFLAPPAWEAVVTADRAQFDRFAVSGLTFPADQVARRFVLEAAKVRIGRSRGRPGEATPEIDLAEDPGVSHVHAVLERRDDGAYALRDAGSTNGTTLNDEQRPVSTDAAVPLADGDRIRLGAWTTITVRMR